MPRADQAEASAAEGSTQPSFLRRLRTAGGVAIGEATRGTPAEWLLLVATAASLVFDWGPGNEWLLGYVGGSAFGSFEPATVPGLLAYGLLVGVLTGAASWAAQSVLGILMAGSLRVFPQAFAYWSASRHSSAERPRPSGNRPDLVTALTLGAAIAVIEQNFRQPGRTFRDDAALVLGAATIIGAFNVVLVAALGIVGYLLERAGHADLASLLEAVAKNPLTYIAAFIVIKVGQIAARRLKAARR